jgi:hypothetical protein
MQKNKGHVVLAIVMTFLILLLTASLSPSVVLQILQSHSRLKGLAELVAGCASPDLIKDPIE